MNPSGLLKDFADFCYPQVCTICAAPAEQWPLCTDCLTSLLAIEAHPYCQLCAMPLADRGAPCPHCLGKGIRPFRQVHRLCNYNDPVRFLIQAMKFHGAWSIAEFLADRLFAQEPIRKLLETTDVIVPVPLHEIRRITRGYNQSEIIARRLARLSRKRLRFPAVRLLNTDAQSTLHSRAQRVENLRHAFGLLQPGRIAGKRVLVVDDVRTTAATLTSFGLCLKTAAPAELNAVVIAVADPHHANFGKI